MTMFRKKALQAICSIALQAICSISVKSLFALLNFILNNIFSFYNYRDSVR
jgi:hypothetical protein